MRLVSFVTMTLLLVFSSGCGTMANCAGNEIWLIGPPPVRDITPFGGVDNDLRLMARGPGGVPLGVIDMPFSLVGDVVTLPWTVYQSLSAEQRSICDQEDR